MKPKLTPEQIRLLESITNDKERHQQRQRFFKEMQYEASKKHNKKNES